jgi:type I restriction enzyme S subunit
MIEWRKMWEVTTWDKKFSGVDKSMQPQIIKYHYYLANELNELERLNGDVRILYTTDKIAFADSTEVEGTISEGEVVTIPWGGNVSIKYYNGRFVTADNRIATSSNKNILSNKFLYYWMLSQKELISSFYRGAGIKHPSMLAVLNMQIPIPNLAEQKRIVDILDTFTASIDNLKEQIELRRKQFEYYRNSLLDLEGKENVDVVKLGELFTFKNGLNKGKEYFGTGKPIIMFTNVFNSRYIKASMIKSRVEVTKQELERIDARVGDVFFTRTSETKEEVGYASVLIDEIEDCTFAGFLIRARPITQKLMPGYCKYCFSTPKVREDIVSKSSFTTRASLTGGGLGNVTIHIPPLDKQNRIVGILDNFEAVISNLEVQLKYRQKQYEYYRNKLLTFD